MNEQKLLISTVFGGQCRGKPRFWLTGPMAFNESYVCLGTNIGYAVLEYPNLELLANENVHEEGGDHPIYCDAIQMCGERLLIIHSSHGYPWPNEWRVFVVNVEGGDVEKSVCLPTGYWCVVSGPEGNEVILYDRRREKGIVRFDVETENVVWSRDGFGQIAGVRYNYWSKSLLVLGHSGLLTEVSMKDGSARTIVRLPESATIKWTAVSRLSDKLYAAGGFDKATRRYILALFDDSNGETRVETHFYRDFFKENGDRCDRVLDRYAGNKNPYYPDKDPDSQLDTDIDNVVGLFAGRGGVIWAVVGGMGMGWDYSLDISGCALLETRLDAFCDWENFNLSEYHGCSSVLQLPNRDLLIQVAGDVMHVRQS